MPSYCGEPWVLERVDHSVFALTNPDPDGGGVNIMLFVSSLRLDCARRTVLLDCAVLPLTPAIVTAFEKSGFVAQLMEYPSRGATHVKVDGEEMRLWKEVLPAWVERCRGGAWSHREGCEYRDATGRYRAPIGVGMGEEVVCRCGLGVFPTGWAVENAPMWEAVRGLCVRAAISPLFPSALAEDVLPDLDDLRARVARAPQAAGDAPAEDDVARCRGCGKTGSKDGGALKACSRCIRVRYCGRACQ